LQHYSLERLKKMAGDPGAYVSVTSMRRLSAQALDQAREIQELKYLLQQRNGNGNGRKH
jgi:hypothetical protein